MRTLYKHLYLAATITLSSLGIAHAQTEEQNLKAVDRGHYLAVLGDCAACHSASNRDAYSGGVGFALPIGTIYATNITPDKKEGIGMMSEQDFAKAVRQGIGKKGQALYPAMPYPSYARITDTDIHDLYLYFMKGVAPSTQPPPKNTIVWPLSMRWPLRIWQVLFSPKPKNALTDTLGSSADPVVQRGAYLAQGLGHCGACHTPRGIFMQERALTDQNKTDYLKGGQKIDGWIAPSLRNDDYLGLKRWSTKDFRDFLKTGRSAQAITFGGMNDVIEKSTSMWSEDDIIAIAAYLKTLPASSKRKWEYDASTSDAIQRGKSLGRGSAVYLDRCAVCHSGTGLGYPTAFPPLAGNAAVLDPDPTSLVHIIQSGAVVPSIKPEAPSSLAMPALGLMLSDKEIADVATFTRQAWGNSAGKVTVNQVKNLKKTAPAIVTPEKQPNN